MLPKPLVVCAATTICFLTVLTVASRRVFTEKIYEHGDAAANTILIWEAKRGQLLVGNYSRMEFNHPGPAILYVQALAEITCYDWLHLVPAPHNAHMLGAIFLNSALLGLCLAMLSSHWNSWLAVLASLAVFLGYFGWTGILAAHWYPDLYFACFLTFAVAAASVAAGRLRHLPFMGLGGSLAVHGHVCFVLFIVLISLAVLGWVLWRYRFNVRRLTTENRRSLIELGLVVGIFALPILLHVMLHYPGEIGKYISFARSNRAGGHDWLPSLRFSLRCLTHDSPHRKALALALFLAGGLSLLRRVSGAQTTVARAMVAVCLLTTAVFIYYASHGVDDLQFTYVGIFYGSVFLILLTTAAMNVTVLLTRNAIGAGATAVLATVGAGHAMHTGAFLNDYAGCPEVPAFIEALERDPKWGKEPVLISCNIETWPVAAGFVVEMARRGNPVYLADESWSFLFTSRFTQLPEDLYHRHRWRLDFVRPGQAAFRVLARTDQVALQELETHYPLGSVVVFDNHARAFTLRGWDEGGSNGKWTVGPRAVLALDLDPIEHDVELTVTADGFVADQHPQTSVKVIVNDQVVDQWTFQKGESRAPRRTVLSSEVVNRKAPLQIVFEAPDPCSPAELGLSKDPRRLGIYVHTFRLGDPGVKKSNRVDWAQPSVP
jgi:hypothetical protein